MAILSVQSSVFFAAQAFNLFRHSYIAVAKSDSYQYQVCPTVLKAKRDYRRTDFYEI